jgi:hypothetical protein
MPDAASPVVEVTWQVAFFALAPLALACMTQPVGRVCGNLASLRFWMRANPLVCAGDVLHYFVRIFLDYALEPCWSWRHFRVALADRFRDTDWSAPRPEFEQTAIGRWALLLLGGIPCQTIKLVTMRGIPVTQSVALTYAVALVFGEALNLSAEVYLRNQNAGDDFAARPSSQLQLSPTSPSLVSRCVFLGLHILQAAPVWWLTPNLFAALGEAVNFRPLALAAVIISAIFPAIICSYGWVWFVYRGTGHRFFGEGDVLSLPIISFPFSMLSFQLLLESSYILDRVDGYVRSFFGVYGFVLLGLGLFAFFCWLAIIAFWLLGSLARSRVGRILGLPRSSLELRSFVMFLLLLLLVVLSYAYVFDSAGTVNPGWLAVFG